MTERTTPPAPSDGAPPNPGRRAAADAAAQVRLADLEPYVGLRYLSKLFRLIAIILVLLLVAEVITGLTSQGVESIPTLVAEVSRLVVLAALLWGIGDLVLLLIDVGHDVRAARLLIGRQTAHLLHPTRASSAASATPDRAHDALPAPIAEPVSATMPETTPRG